MPPLLPRWLGAVGPEARGPTFFVTWWLQSRQRVLEPSERHFVCSVLRRGHDDRYDLRAYVVMDNHVHVLVTVTRLPIERLVHSWKSFTAHELQRLFRRKGRVWERDGLTSPVVGAEALRVKAEYVVGNPWKRWPFLKRYPWVWEANGADDASQR
jgi:REP element-mobilizing transposase RayT